MILRNLFTSAAAAVVLSLMAAVPGHAQYTIGDREIDGSLCVGNDCVNGESFSFDTIRMKENNTRVKFMDTSGSASFPQNDWQLRANESSNGGRNAFFIDDMGTANTTGQTPESTPFTIEANAATNAFYIDDAERVGLSTSSPATELHIVDGDTAAVRLQQDGSSGFAPYTWDVAGNETNFFIRDVTGGSSLPLRIRPGAPTDSIEIEASGDVSIGAGAGGASLHVRRTDGTGQMIVEEAGSTAANRLMMRLVNNGSSQFSMENTANSTDWRIQNFGGNMQMSLAGSGGTELLLDGSGNMTVRGNIVSGGGGTCDPGPCDAVFDPAVYTVPSIEDHAAFMWENKRLPALDPTLPGQPINLTLKLTRMLNELEHAHIYIEQLHKRVEELESKL